MARLDVDPEVGSGAPPNEEYDCAKYELPKAAREFDEGLRLPCLFPCTTCTCAKTQLVKLEVDPEVGSDTPPEEVYDCAKYEPPEAARDVGEEGGSLSGQPITPLACTYNAVNSQPRASADEGPAPDLRTDNQLPDLAGGAHEEAKPERWRPPWYDPKRIVRWVVNMSLPCVLAANACKTLLGVSWVCALLLQGRGVSNMCPQDDRQLPIIHISIAHMFSAFDAAVALHMFDVASTAHLRSAAWFGALVWSEHSTDGARNLMICEGIENPDPSYLGIAFFIQFFCVGLVQGRLAAVETSSLQALGARRLRQFMVVWLLLTTLFFVMVALYGLESQIALAFIYFWWICFMSTNFIALRGLVAALRLAWAAEAQVSTAEDKQRGEHVGRAAAALKTQVWAALTAIFFGTMHVLAWYLVTDLPLWPLSSVVKQDWHSDFHQVCYSLDAISNGYFGLTLCGSGRSARQRTTERQRRVRWQRASRAWWQARNTRPKELSAWDERVCELAGRGVCLDALLHFFKGLGKDYMPHFDPARHTTLDVVRQAINPLSTERQCAYAVLLQGGKYTRPSRMVTHNWSNLFADLIASVLADALCESDFSQIAQLLVEDIGVLHGWISHLGLGSRTYWICAFAVNQHRSICSESSSDRVDSVSGRQHPCCHCNLPKALNHSPPTLADGRSVPCEMNKFMDMLRLLAATDSSFEHIIAVDRGFRIFTRAWCMAEIAVGAEVGVQQQLKLFSTDCLAEHEERLRGLSIRNMESHRPEDKQEILAGIEDLDAFDRNLQRLLFEDLLPAWAQLDGAERMALAGRAIRWQRVQSKNARLGVGVPAT